MSDLIRPGYPRSNVLLAGLTALSEGGDLEALLAQRDAVARTPQAFLELAWEALAWLPPEGPLAPELLGQMASVWLAMHRNERAVLLAQWNDAPVEGAQRAWMQMTREDADGDDAGDGT